MHLLSFFVQGLLSFTGLLDTRLKFLKFRLSLPQGCREGLVPLPPFLFHVRLLSLKLLQSLLILTVEIPLGLDVGGVRV